MIASRSETHEDFSGIIGTQTRTARRKWDSRVSKGLVFSGGVCNEGYKTFAFDSQGFLEGVARLVRVPAARFKAVKQCLNNRKALGLPVRSGKFAADAWICVCGAGGIELGEGFGVLAGVGAGLQSDGEEVRQESTLSFLIYEVPILPHRMAILRGHNDLGAACVESSRLTIARCGIQQRKKSKPSCNCASGQNKFRKTAASVQNGAARAS